MTGYERAVEYAKKNNSYSLLTALLEEGREGDGVDYNMLVDEWETPYVPKQAADNNNYDTVVGANITSPPWGKPGQGAKE